MPLLKSWVASANTADTPFPLNNLPYGVFSVGVGQFQEDVLLDRFARESERDALTGEAGLGGLDVPIAVLNPARARVVFGEIAGGGTTAAAAKFERSRGGRRRARTSVFWRRACRDGYVLPR